MFEPNFEDFSLLQLICSGIFIFSVFIQLCYFLIPYLKLVLHKNSNSNEGNLPVSVIVCAKNEEKRLRELVPILFEQSYPNFELIVVNDGSWDDSQETLDAFRHQYKNLKVVEIPEEGIRMQGKKFALTLGIKAASHDRLLITDADCMPQSKNWISKMVSTSSDERGIVLGYSPYSKRKTFLNRLIRYDTFFSAINYLSFSKIGIPYMGVGRNLSYNKESFFEVGGFRKHSFIQSGDDDLFINQIANKKNTSIQIDPDTWMVSEPKESFKDWWYQKKRHLLTAPHYKFKHKFFLALFPLTYYFLIMSFIGLLFLRTWILLVIPIFCFRFFLQIIIFKLSSNKLGESKIAWTSPFWELTLMTINPMIYISNLIKKPVEWN